MSTKTTIEADGTITTFKDWIKADGSTEFQPEAGRYHLYVQHLCPFANRATIGRAIKGLEKVITQDVVDYELESSEIGWKFSPEKDGCDADSVNGAEFLREVFDASAKTLGASAFAGKTTVPTLYDKKLGRIVSTESADILHMLNSEFNEFCETEEQKKLNLYPESLKDEISEMEKWTLMEVIYGVYGPLLAKTQESYDAAITKLFGGLDKLEVILSRQRYLTGSQLTGADIKLFTALIRFDAVYSQSMCAKKRVYDYPSLWGYVRDLYQMPAIKSTVHFDHIMKGYFMSHYYRARNPLKLVPVRPDIDYDQPTGRDKM